jgi:hypothetical protein
MPEQYRAIGWVGERLYALISKCGKINTESIITS